MTTDTFHNAQRYFSFTTLVWAPRVTPLFLIEPESCGFLRIYSGRGKQAESVVIRRQGPRLTLKKSGGRTKYLKSGISTLTADISAKCHCFHKSGAFLELPMHEFSESVEKLKKNSLT